MSIRARFYRYAWGFLLVLTSGTFTPAVADSLSPSRVSEDAFRLPLRDGVMSIDLSVEPTVEDGGSTVEVMGPVVDDGSWRPRVEVDPWAEAFAESSRLAHVVPPAVGVGSTVPLNQQVQYFLDRFTRDRRQVVDKWFGRAGRYLDMIRDTLRSHGLPEDLAFVAMIESGFNPVAVSRAGAKGLWQFMAGTARRYGLRVDQWVDERFDPEKSTLAAAAYLRDLHAQFGSWSLAQAAYNAGESTVARAIRSVGSTDFWALAGTGFLRTETKEFVPRIHAATVIGQDPSRYGFDVRGHAQPVLEFVSVPPSTPLKSVSASSGVSMDALRDLNPVLVQGVTPPGGPYRLRVPAGTGSRVQATLAQAKPVASAPTVSRVHVVRLNETLAGIAKRYGVSVRDVLRWNNLSVEGGDLIRPGDRLVVAGGRLAAVGNSQPPAR